MAGQVLNTTININARGNGFNELGSQIAAMGNMINGLSTKLIQFGEESIEVYRDYEKSLADAEVALSTTYGRGTRELNQVVGQLDTAATEWAANTIFHTNDVGNAISEAAHAGWDYQQIMAGIPAAMQLAQAGSIDLSEAVNYIVKSTTAAGVGFEDMGDFIDMWAYAANSSASNIDEFGEAMLRMGSTMKFVSNPAELFTLIATAANAGTVGSDAGTMIRNSIMRLVAPTDKATDAMAELGATTDEMSEVMGNTELEAANARLAEFGFTVYDSEGQLRPILDIYNDLYVALGQLAGGFENIATNDDALNILSAIFPTRSITGALNMLQGAADGYNGLYDAMERGDAAGYGEYAASTMMDTLYGKIETFGSKMERLKQLVGAELAPQLEQVLGFFGNVVDSVSNLDDVKFSALTSGLEAIAVAGPVLIGVGGAMKLIGSLANPVSVAAAAVAALAFGIGAVNAANEELYKQNFGDLELDQSKISAHLQTLKTKFDEANASINTFNTALQEAVTTYTSDTGELKSTLIQSMLDGVEIKEGSPEYTKIMGLGEQIGLAVEAGVSNGYASTLTSLSQTFGGNELGEDVDSGLWSQIVSVMEEGMQAELGRAQSVGQRLRDALTEAFKDGHLTSDEISNIQSIMDEGNEILAEQQAQDRYVEQQRMLRKAQTLGLDTINESVGEITAQRDEIVEELNQQQDADYYRLTKDYERKIANGEMIENADGSGYHVATEADLAAAQAELRNAQAAARQATIADYQDYAANVYELGVEGSDIGDTWEAFKQLGADYIAEGSISDAARQRYIESSDKEDAGAVTRYITDMVNALGGESALSDMAEYMRANGQTDRAAEYNALLGMYQLAAQGSFVVADPNKAITVNQPATEPIEGAPSLAELTAMVNAAYQTSGDERMRDLVQYAQSSHAMGERPDWENYLDNDALYSQLAGMATALGVSITDIINQVAGNLTLDPEVETDGIDAQVNAEPHDVTVTPQVDEVPPQQVQVEPVMGDTSIGAQSVQVTPNVGDVSVGAQQMQVEPVLDDVSVSPQEVELEPVVDEIPEQQGTVALDAHMGELPDLNGLSATVELTPHVDGENAVDSLQGQGVNVDVSGDTQQLSASIHGYDGMNLMTYVDGDATGLEMSIKTQDGRTLMENVHGNTTELASAIQRFAGQTITVNIRGRQMFASGGRATVASTFGEAGPEWAIPEQHTRNTASLLNQARAASGFSWPELIASTSGLSTAAKSVSQTMVYSPTIYTNSAADLDDTLREDKRRFARWAREQKQRDELEVFA